MYAAHRQPPQLPAGLRWCSHSSTSAASADSLSFRSLRSSASAASVSFRSSPQPPQLSAASLQRATSRRPSRGCSSHQSVVMAHGQRPRAVPASRTDRSVRVARAEPLTGQRCRCLWAGASGDVRAVTGWRSNAAAHAPDTPPSQGTGGEGGVGRALR